MLTARVFGPCTRSLTNHVRVSLNAVTATTKQAPLIQRLQLQDRTYATGFRNADHPQDHQRIYYGSLASRMKAVKVFSLTTSIVGLAAQPILMEQGIKLGGIPMGVFICGVGGFFTFVTPILLHFVTKKYVTEIHYDPKTDEYTATTISLFLRKIKTKFHPSDVKVPEVPGMFTSFHVGKRALFVDPTMFEDTEHYVRIMGYDKPIDFKLNLDEVIPELKQNEDALAGSNKKQN